MRSNPYIAWHQHCRIVKRLREISERTWLRLQKVDIHDRKVFSKTADFHYYFGEKCNTQTRRGIKIYERYMKWCRGRAGLKNA